MCVLIAKTTQLVKFWVLCLSLVYILAEDIKEMLPQSVTCFIPDAWLDNLFVPSVIIVHKHEFFLLSSPPLTSLGLCECFSVSTFGS